MTDLTLDSVVLTDKQQRFVDEYLIDSNATQAAIRAGYSDKTAAVIGAQNLIKLNIAAAIKAGQKDIAKRNGLTIDDILDELEEARKIAKEEGKGAPMVAATMGKAKVLGLLVDKQEIKSEGSISIDISFK